MPIEHWDGPLAGLIGRKFVDGAWIEAGTDADPPEESPPEPEPQGADDAED